jgi:hypothetical protein
LCLFAAISPAFRFEEIGRKKAQKAQKRELQMVEPTANASPGGALGQCQEAQIPRGAVGRLIGKTQPGSGRVPITRNREVDGGLPVRDLSSVADQLRAVRAAEQRFLKLWAREAVEHAIVLPALDRMADDLQGYDGFSGPITPFLLNGDAAPDDEQPGDAAR